MKHSWFLCGAALCWALTTAGPVLAADAEQRMVREAVDVARALRRSPDVYDRMSAAGTLVDIGDKTALQFLADHLAHPDWSTKRSAIDTLLSVQHPAGLDLIYRYAAVDGDEVFMKFLAESCASQPRDDMSEFLMQALALDDPWVRKHALQALALAPLADKEARMRAIAEDTDEDVITRAYAYYALMDTAARNESVAPLVELAREGGAEAQEAAAVALGTLDNAATRQALEDLRAARTYKVQMAAMVSEAGFGMQEAVKTLVHTIAFGKGLDPAVAAASVRRLPGPIAAQVTHVLLECCELGSDVGTRLIEAWDDIEADPGEIYAWGLAHANADIRMQAIWLVGQRSDRAYVERLAPMLEDADSGVRGMAAWSIVRILGGEYAPGTEI